MTNIRREKKHFAEKINSYFVSNNNRNGLLQDNDGGRVGNENMDTKDKLRSVYDLEQNRRPQNSRELLETEVVLLSKKSCKQRWPQRYHYIINNYMICSKDSTDTESMSKACAVSIFIYS